MKTTTAWILAASLFTLPVPSAFGVSELSVNQVLEPGQIKEYVHYQAIVLTQGFWAKAGSAVTAKIEGMDLLQMGGYPGPGDPPRVSSVRSGSPGDASVSILIGRNVHLPNPANYYAINAIEIQEENDNPCFLRLWGNMVDPRYSKDQDRRIVAQFELEKCKGSTTWVDTEMVGFQPTQKKFIRAVNVCGGHAHLLPQELYLATNWEIKGLRVKPGLVSSTGGAVTALDDSHEFTRYHCPEHGAGDLGDLQGSGWTSWSTCPVEGQLATGITLYYHKDKWFTGIDLACGYVQQLYGPIPVKDEKGY